MIKKEDIFRLSSHLVSFTSYCTFSMLNVNLESIQMFALYFTVSIPNER